MFFRELNKDSVLYSATWLSQVKFYDGGTQCKLYDMGYIQRHDLAK